MTEARPYALINGRGEQGAFGLIVLQTDETIEPEMSRLLQMPGTVTHVSRIASDPVVSPQSLARMEGEMTASAALLPATIDFDVVGYGCTSGATVIGSKVVEHRIRDGCNTRHVTDPLAALLAACSTFGIKRLAFLTPYAPAVSQLMREKIEATGISIAGFGSFEEEQEAKVARIDPQSTLEAAIFTCRSAPCDGVFMSCTNLQTIDILAEVEEALGVPALSSNQVLAWHMAALAGGDLPHKRYGRVMENRLST